MGCFELVKKLEEKFLNPVIVLTFFCSFLQVWKKYLAVTCIICVLTYTYSHRCQMLFWFWICWDLNQNQEDTTLLIEELITHLSKWKYKYK